ncbi:MAG: ABC transporter permease subunit [Nitriliruptorales bacterium]|nr:ABC transporter permease subunit [Nitriliruptorales bacterium]
MNTSRAGLFASRLALLVAFLALWEVVTGGLGLGIVLFEPLILPSPSTIVVEMWGYAESGLLPRDVQATLWAAFLGLVFGVLGGALVGVFFAYWRIGALLLEPAMVAINSLPRITVAPLLILWFGLGITSQVALSLFTVFFVIFWNTYLGIRTVEPDLLRVMKVMGGSRLDVGRMVVLPTVVSWIFAALRTSVSFALSGAVVAEFVGSTRGLGYRMTIAAGLLNTPRVFAIMVILGVVAVLLVRGAEKVERRALRWRPDVGRLT